MRHGHVLQPSCMGRELFFFFACASARFYLLICFPKLPFCAAQVICSASESPLVTSPGLPLTLAASSKGAWACCGACNVCSLIGRAATASLPWGVSSASRSAPGETGRPPLLAQGQFPQHRRFPHAAASSLSSVSDCCLSLIGATC